MYRTATRKMFFQTGCFVRKDDSRKITHLLLDGGKVHISKKNIKNFHDKYEIDYNVKKYNFISENRTPEFKLFFDLDFHEKKQLTDEKILDCTKTIQNVIKDYYPDIDTSVVICMCDSKNKTVNKIVYVKTGVHLIFPFIYTNVKYAMKLRKGILQKLESRYGKRHSDDPWYKVVDDTVFKTNGLRMIGSSKLYICPVCKGNKKGDFCNECNGFGKIDEERIYLPKFYKDSNFEDICRDINFREYLDICSIRTNEDLIKMQTPEWVDEFFFTGIDPKKKKQTQNINSINVSDEDTESMKTHKILSEMENKTIISDIQRTIRKEMPSIYKDLIVTNIYKCNENTNNYYLIRTNHTYCMNKVGYHTTNTIYFVINKHGIYVKCFCRCPVSRKFGTCQEYKSSKYTLKNLKLKQKLFPDYKNFETPKNKLQEYQFFLDILKEEIDGKKTHEQKFFD